MAGIADFYGPLYKGLDTFNREMIGFIPSVTLDADVARASKFDEVLSPVATASEVVDLEEASWNAYAPTDTGSVDSVKVRMDNFKVVRIELGGEQTRALDNSGNYDAILEGKIQDAFRKLANGLEQYTAQKAIEGASRAVGVAGTTPFGVAQDMSDFASLAQVLDDNGAPQEDRNIVLSSTAMANLRGKQTILLKTNEAGTDEFLRSGYTNPVLGFKLWNSAGLKRHAQGAGAGYLVNGAQEAGTSALTVDTGTGAINAGDVVEIDGVKYVINEAAESGATSLTLGKPGLVEAVKDNTIITPSADFTPSVAFQKNAIVLATRQLSDPMGGDGCDEQYTLVDPFSGIAFDVRLYRMYHKAWLEIGLAYGAKVVKSDNVALLLG